MHSPFDYSVAPILLNFRFFFFFPPPQSPLWFARIWVMTLRVSRSPKGTVAFRFSFSPFLSMEGNLRTCFVFFFPRRQSDFTAAVSLRDIPPTNPFSRGFFGLLFSDYPRFPLFLYQPFCLDFSVPSVKLDELRNISFPNQKSTLHPHPPLSFA